MSGDLNQRPFLMLILKVMRVMLWICIAGLLLVGGAIWYSVTTVQGRGYAQFTSTDSALFAFIAGLAVFAGLLVIGVHRMLKEPH